ncbi:hypothetical protein ACGF1Z_22565 [Streptomyces sp. NPDC048018]
MESIPATFGARGVLMALGFPTCAFPAIASQTPKVVLRRYPSIHIYTHM